jgi:hypothetical protein
VLPLYRESSALSKAGRLDTCSLHCGYKEEDSLRISQSVPELRPLPMIVNGDSLILSHSVPCDLSLARSEPPSIGVVVGHKICKDKCKYETERSKEEEEDLPCGYRRVVNYEQLVRDA